MMHLNKIIITGGSNGIGKALLKNFLTKSFKVLCLSRTKPKIKNNNLTFIKIDLSKRKQLLKLKKKIIDFDAKYLICNAANLGEINYFENINLKKWENSFFLNLFSHIYITKFCLNSIKKKKRYHFLFSRRGCC